MPLRALAFAIAMLSFSASLRAEDTLPTNFSGFLPSGQYVLVLDGQEVKDARIYRSESDSAYLILSQAIEGGVILLPRRRCVDEVRVDEIFQAPDGSLEVRKASIDCSFGPFELQRTDIVFHIHDREAQLKPKPALLGVQDAAGLLAHTPEYARTAATYVPDPTMLASLQGATTDIHVTVFFGSWCTFCTRFLPLTLRLEQMLAGSKIHFTYVGLQPPPAAWISEDAVKNGIKKLITGIVTIDGREVGRIIGNEWTQPEKALLRFVR